jgi:hypothetical protein
MRVFDIINEEKVDEAPTSGIANLAKKGLGKVAGAVGMSGTAGRMGGSAEVGTKANELYKSIARWQGINQKNDKNMTAADVQAWAKQNKINVSKVQMPDGVLPKKLLMDILKKVAASELTGGNVSAAPAQGGGGGGAGSAPAQGGAMNRAMNAIQQKATGKPADTSPNAEPGAEPQAQKTGQSPEKSNVAPLKNKDGIPPNIQKMLDELTPTEKKALAGVI